MRNRDFMRSFLQIQLFIAEIEDIQAVIANNPNQKATLNKIISSKLGAISAYADFLSKEMMKKAESANKKGGK